jgi:protein-S-isoprenylcysteine O-methyltransferase Ste14
VAGAVEHGGALIALPARAAAGGLPAAPRWLRFRPPVLAAALTAAALLLHAVSRGLDAPFGTAPAGGAALMLAGLAWAAWAALQFRRSGTPVRPGAAAGVLVDEGPFRLGRNPMYLGMTALMLGLALALGSVSVALAAIAFVAVMNRVHIPHEEARLRQAFGGWYSDYTATVRRWL